MIDLHIHSKRSDGSYSLEAIAMFYMSQGFDTIAITDHDRLIDDQEIKKAYQGRDIEIIPGVEVSAYDPLSGRKVHLLGYFIRNKKGLKDILGQVTASRREAGKKIILDLARDGYPISHIQVMQLAGTGGIYKQHILHYLQEKGYKDFRDADFRAGGDYYHPIDYVDYRQALGAIKTAGGVAVLAHPGESGVFDLVGKMVEDGLDGLQVKHPAHGPLDIKEAAACIKRHALIPFTGSDNHGKYGQEVLDFKALQLGRDQDQLLRDFLKERGKKRDAL